MASQVCRGTARWSVGAELRSTQLMVTGAACTLLDKSGEWVLREIYVQH